MQRVSIIAVALIVTGCSTVKSPIMGKEAARQSIRDYCEDQARYSSGACAVFERAMAGDFAALHSVLAESTYQGQDTSFDHMVPEQLLVVVGDDRFAAFVKSQRPQDRDRIIVGPPGETQKEESAFAEQFPKTYALWKAYGPYSEYTRERMRQEYLAQRRKKA